MNRRNHLYFALILSFILGIQGENIALWRKGEASPMKVFPYRAAMLPPDARAALEKGLEISGAQELEELAENYLS